MKTQATKKSKIDKWKDSSKDVHSPQSKMVTYRKYFQALHFMRLLPKYIRNFYNLTAKNQMHH